MNFLNRFIPWLCFATFVTIMYMIIWHCYKATMQLPNIVSLNNENGTNEFNLYFIFYTILYFVPFIEISCLALFVD
jgi:cytosine/uracil/thiamine/allantoin permease